MYMMLNFLIVYVLISVTAIVEGQRTIEDPFNIFCGSIDCYDVLNLKRDASVKDIKKSYRKLSLQYHPDKNKDPEAEEIFVKIAKASEVLSDVEQRELYDYYLDHPREYYKVTGKYYFRALPKADVRIIIAGVILFFSFLLPIVQYQKHQRAVNYLTHATINNLGLKNGGTKETMELYRRAEELFKARYAERNTSSSTASRKSNKEKCPSGSKMLKDPMFKVIVDEVVAEVKIEGGYKKPTFKDIFAVQLIMFPYKVYNWGRKKYRILFKENELTNDECLDLTIEIIGAGTWDDMSSNEQSEAVKRRLWLPGRLEEYHKEKEEEYMRKNPAIFKRYQRYKKKEKLG